MLYEVGYARAQGIRSPQRRVEACTHILGICRGWMLRILAAHIPPDQAVGVEENSQTLLLHTFLLDVSLFFYLMFSLPISFSLFYQPFSSVHIFVQIINRVFTRCAGSNRNGYQLSRMERQEDRDSRSSVQDESAEPTVENRETQNGTAELKVASDHVSAYLGMDNCNTTGITPAKRPVSQPQRAL
ncbi:hypothetical protein B0T13DRAFT_41437 [Neurospora crassa]|nr:hypothetical protein B0T13DRAFT_41437 [Neurospora crassa]